MKLTEKNCRVYLCFEKYEGELLSLFPWILQRLFYFYLWYNMVSLSSFNVAEMMVWYPLLFPWWYPCQKHPKLSPTGYVWQLRMSFLKMTPLFDLPNRECTVVICLPQIEMSRYSSEQLPLTVLTSTVVKMNVPWAMVAPRCACGATFFFLVLFLNVPELPA